MGRALQSGCLPSSLTRRNPPRSPFRDGRAHQQGGDAGARLEAAKSPSALPAYPVTGPRDTGFCDPPVTNAGSVDEQQMGALQELRLAGERRLTLPIVFDDENRLVRADAICAVQAGRKRRVHSCCGDVGGAESLDLYPSGAAAKQGQVLRAWGYPQVFC